MVRRWVLAMALAGAASAAMAAQWDVPALMALLAQHPSGKARFTETKTLSVLDDPVVSTGTLVYSPPDRLEKNTVKPKPELMLVERDKVVVERDGKRREVRLQQYPEVLSMVEAIRGTLIGNQKLLNEHYELRLRGTEQDWRLILTPREERLSRWVTQIIIQGRRNAIGSIETIQADGDRSMMTIQPDR